jgi:hypothetical protein
MTFADMTFLDLDGTWGRAMAPSPRRSLAPWGRGLGGLLLAAGLISCQGVGITSDRLPSLGLPLPLAQLQGPPVGLDTLPQTPVGQTLAVEGTVTQAAPLGGGGVYQVQDATGTAWIRTEDELPQIGTVVRVQGQLQYQSILVGGRDRGEHYLQEQQRTVVATAETADPTDSPTLDSTPTEAAPSETTPLEAPASAPGESSNPEPN